MNTRFVSLLSIGIAIFFILALALHHTKISSEKTMNGDEGAGIALSCAPSYTDLFISGVAGVQCSPQPLYYIFQKIGVQVMNSFGKNILLQERLVSIVSAAISLILLFILVAKNIGWGYGILSLLIVAQQHNFHYYAAEARPYQLWMACYILHIIYSLVFRKYWIEVSVAKGSEEKGSGKFYRISIGYLLSSILLTMVAGPGWLQCFVNFVVVFLTLPKELKKKYTPVLAIIASVVLLIGIYYTYTTTGCRYEFLTYTLENLEAIYVLFLPWGMGAVPLNILVLLGMSLPFWKKYRSSPIRLLGIIALLQLLLAVLLIPIVMYKKYYLIARLFLYLTFLRAIFISMGAYMAYNFFEKKIRYSLPMALVALAVFFMFVTNGVPTRYMPVYDKIRTQPFTEEQCGILKAARKYGSLVFSPTTSSDYHSEYINFIAWFLKQESLCNGDSNLNSIKLSQEGGTVLINPRQEESAYSFSIVSRDSSTPEIHHCGYKVISY